MEQTLKSWNRDIAETMELAGVSFEEVPQHPEQITVPYGTNTRQLYRIGHKVYVTGQDSSGNATTHFCDSDTWAKPAT